MASRNRDVLLWLGMFIQLCTGKVLAAIYILVASIMVFGGVGALLLSTVRCGDLSLVWQAVRRLQASQCWQETAGAQNCLVALHAGT